MLQPLRVAPHALGILQRDGIAPCQYEGLVTNGDLSYTYFGWQLNYPATGGRHVNEGLAERLALPATGPAEVVAILAHLNRELAALPTRRKRAETLFRIRNNAINLRTIILSQTDLERLFPPRPLPGSRSSSNAPPVLNRLWAGWYFLEQEESGQTDLAGKPPPVRPWHATTPIMWDTVLQIDPHTPSFVHREPNGLNVLFMDGHVEFLSYPGKFPASESFATMRRVKRRY